MFGFRPYVSVAARRAISEKGRAKLEKKLGRSLQPIRTQGRKIVQNWWGKAWMKNLESYSDFSNRLPRGRAYLGNGSVIDLQIVAGKVSAMVQGSDTKPYSIEIIIDPLTAKNKAKLQDAVKGKLHNVQELLLGKFPEELGDVFLNRGKGLFPSNKEIHIDCSCPDYATLCKHAAAALYGVGVLLDSQPELLFTLRGLSLSEMLGDLLKVEAKKLSKPVKGKTKKDEQILELDDSSLSELFGVDIATEPKPAKVGVKKIVAKPAKKVVKKAVKKTEKKVAKKVVKKTAKKAVKKAAKSSKQMTQKALSQTK